MRVDFEHISNLCWSGLMQKIEGPLGSYSCDPHHYQEALFLLQIKQALSEKKKRITINVKYPK